MNNELREAQRQAREELVKALGAAAEKNIAPIVMFCELDIVTQRMEMLLIEDAEPEDREAMAGLLKGIHDENARILEGVNDG